MPEAVLPSLQELGSFSRGGACNLGNGKCGLCWERGEEELHHAFVAYRKSLCDTQKELHHMPLWHTGKEESLWHAGRAPYAFVAYRKSLCGMQEEHHMPLWHDKHTTVRKACAARNGSQQKNATTKKHLVDMPFGMQAVKTNELKKHVGESMSVRTRIVGALNFEAEQA
eukprot:scaffold201394_cov21-Tisochrysis_lutea.AAC.1